MTQNQLDEFGQALMMNVRDRVIEEMLAIRKGEYKSKPAIQFRELINTFPPEDVGGIDKIITETIDRMLHHFLFFFETSDEFTILDKRDATDLVEVSDGLAGELYSEEGWIKKFSECPTSFSSE